MKILVPAGVGGAGLFLYMRHQQTGHLRLVDWIIAGSIFVLSLLVVLSSCFGTTAGWEDPEESPAFSGQRKWLLAIFLLPVLLWGVYSHSENFQDLLKKPDEQMQAARALAQALKTPRVIRTQAGEPDGTGWVPVLSPAGGFSAYVPDRFNEAIVALKMDGRPAPVVVVGARTEELKFVVFAARWSSGPQSLEARARAAVKSFCQFKDPVVLREELYEARFPLIEVEGDAPKAKGLARIIATDKAVYGLAVEGPELTASVREAARRFFDSFAIVAPEPNEAAIRDAVDHGEPNRGD